ncbi:Transcriptional regulator TACO1-like domain 2 [Penicillium soppii]|uniref:Transcriptional regulator TACO1-like domain 2 n=1 Tax=Penicillium soppii TaxID=69789 RepID=UPI0025473396|nr:Transcriptional regulator TACO1-like domain 2 [Penicillium soppii]KAJ5882473.1 Transcriptional regulator TACO1-like domain 2 [Penicillium soppii]
MALRLSRLVPRRQWTRNGLDCRSFSTTKVTLSGHNKWSTIKHDKARNDKAKSRERQMMSKEIASATQMWGPDIKYNPRLALALSNAKRASTPKIIIEAAIARGQGLSISGQALESLTIEAMLPGNVAAVVECQTDQKARVLQDVRYLIKDNGGIVTPTTFLFERKGRVVMEKKENTNSDDYLDQAIEAGAADITTDDKGRLVILTDPSETKTVGETFAKLSGLAIEELEIFWDPNRDSMVEVQDEEQAKALEDLLSALREEPSVQDIYMNSVEKL